MINDEWRRIKYKQLMVKDKEQVINVKRDEDKEYKIEDEGWKWRIKN